MIEFLFAVALGVGSVVLATISVGELVDKKEGKYEIIIPAGVVEGFTKYEKTQSLEIDGKTHTYTVSPIGTQRVLIGEKDTRLNDSTVLYREADKYVGHTDDTHIVELINHFNTHTPKKAEEVIKQNPSTRIDWIK